MTRTLLHMIKENDGGIYLIRIRLFLLGCMAILITSAFPLNAKACSCIELPAAEEEFKVSQAVFSGKVNKVMEDKSMKGYITKSVIFEVTNTWKGVNQTQVKIKTGQGGGDCGIDFLEGVEYLVYAKESEMYGAKALVTTICDRTNKLTASTEDLKVLGKGNPPTEKVDLTEQTDSNPIYVWGAVILTIAIGVILVLLLKNGKRKRPE